MMCRKKAIRVLHFCFLRLLNEKMSVRFKTHLQNQKAKSPLLYENTSGGDLFDPFGQHAYAQECAAQDFGEKKVMLRKGR